MHTYQDHPCTMSVLSRHKILHTSISCCICGLLRIICLIKSGLDIMLCDKTTANERIATVTQTNKSFAVTKLPAPWDCPSFASACLGWTSAEIFINTQRFYYNDQNSSNEHFCYKHDPNWAVLWYTQITLSILIHSRNSQGLMGLFLHKPAETFAEGFLSFQTCQGLRANPSFLTQGQKDWAETVGCLVMVYLKQTNRKKKSQRQTDRQTDRQVGSQVYLYFNTQHSHG